MLTDAIAFLKRAADKTDNYIFHDGWCYVSNSAITAAYPVPDIMGTFALPKAQLEAALGRFDKSPQITGDDNGNMILKSGRLRTSLMMLEALPPEIRSADVEWNEVPDNFIEALTTVMPFVDQDAAQLWQHCIRMSDDKLYALTPKRGIEYQVEGMSEDEALLDAEFVNYLTKLAKPPSQMARSGGSIWFLWSNEAWVKAQLVNTEWPESADRVMTLGESGDELSITDEWRSLCNDAAALSDGEIQICAEGIKARQGTMTVDIDYPSDINVHSKWDVNVLIPVMKIAERWFPNAGSIVRFAGKNFRGVVAGKQ